MIDLKKRGLPNTLEVGGRPFSIYTDFRIWIKVTEDLQKLKPGQYIDLKYIFKNEYPPSISIQEIIPFINPPQELPRSTGEHSDAIPIDYTIDGDLIWAAVLGQYGVDLVEVEELHWWKFLAMIKGLNESTKMREVMGFRCYEKQNDKMDPYEKLRIAWEIIREDEATKEENDRFNAVFEVPEQGQTES